MRFVKLFIAICVLGAALAETAEAGRFFRRGGSCGSSGSHGSSGSSGSWGSCGSSGSWGSCGSSGSHGSCGSSGSWGSCGSSGGSYGSHGSCGSHGVVYHKPVVIHHKPAYHCVNGVCYPTHEHGHHHEHVVPATTSPGAGDPPSAPADPTSAQLRLQVPSNAIVYLRGQRMKSVGSSRTYQIPGMKAGKVYNYDLRVAVVQNGREVSVSAVQKLSVGAKVDLQCTSQFGQLVLSQKNVSNSQLALTVTPDARLSMK